MIIVLGSVVVREGRVNEALSLSQEHVARSRAEPGCIAHAVHQDAENPLRLVFIEHGPVRRHCGSISRCQHPERLPRPWPRSLKKIRASLSMTQHRFRYQASVRPDPSTERTSTSEPCPHAAAAHVKRWTAGKTLLVRIPYILVVALFVAHTSKSVAGSTEAALLETLKVVAQSRPLTDPKTIFRALGIAPELNVRILKDHVRVIAAPGVLQGTPYRDVQLLTLPVDRPTYSLLSVSVARDTMCLTKEDVVGAFGTGFTTEPMIVTDGGGGTYVIYQLQHAKNEPVRTVTFSFDRPEKCASSMQVSAKI
jgi:hypothetical protein